MSTLDLQAPVYTSLPSMASPVYQPLLHFTSVINPVLHATSNRGPVPPITNSVGLFTSANTPMELAMAKKLAEMEALIQQIPESQLHSRRVNHTAMLILYL